MSLSPLLKEAFNAAGDLPDDTRLRNFKDWDSMAHMLFITRLEESYDIVLTGDEIATMETVGDIKKILTAKGKTA
jgi:acyl carrier protein